MTLILTDEINASTPYQVYDTEEANSLIFFSHSGLKFVVSFIKDETLEGCDNIFQFLVEAQSPFRSSNDPKVGETVSCIAKAFFYRHPEGILTFVCDISDAKQAARQRLFTRWFQKYNQDNYIKFDWEIRADENTFYASLIGHKDNPFVEDYKEAYSDFVASLQK